MNRYGVVQSAGDSMQAAYDDFKALGSSPRRYAGKAAKAEKRQESLAVEASELRVAAGRPPHSAASPPTRSPCRSSS